MGFLRAQSYITLPVGIVFTALLYFSPEYLNSISDLSAKTLYGVAGVLLILGIIGQLPVMRDDFRNKRYW